MNDLKLNFDFTLELKQMYAAKRSNNRLYSLS